ncbi:MAG TPA: hydrogenase maturation nickel metallochaperone HypA [Acidothermaceae bacterium]
MHETSLVAELVGECERRARGHLVTRVRVRHASSLEDGALRAIFGALTADGPLAQAILETEEFDAVMTCGDCGYSGAVDHNHVYGHMRICPKCEAICDDAGAVEIELVGIELADS